MNLSKNKFKALSINQKQTYGIWNGLVDTVAAEILAGSGFDWVLIDGEHAPFDLRTIQQQLQVINQYGTEVIVRPPKGETAAIKQLMDIGVKTLLVPMVETADQAVQLVKDMRYPPEGVRGVGTALARASQWNRVNNYFKEANDEMCLICQVESTTGIENLEAILAVENVDGVFIGPADLAASMGYLGQPGHAEVKRVVSKAIRTIKKNGKTAGVLAINPEAARYYQKEGANMTGVGVDTILLAKAAKELAENFKPELKSVQSTTKY